MLPVRVYPSVCHKPVLYRNDWIDPAVFSMDTSFHPKIRVPPKTRVLFSKNFVPNSGLSFATASRSGCQQNSSTLEPVDHAYNSRCAVTDGRWSALTARIVYCTSIDLNTGLCMLIRVRPMCLQLQYAQMQAAEQIRLLYTQGEVTSQSPWSRYDRHFVGITRHNALS